MPDKHQLPKVIPKAWIALRFIVFGVGGFFLLLVCSLVLAEQDYAPRVHYLHLAVALPVATIGALMMLIGAGEWGQWAYLWVFLSTPLGVSLLVLLPAPYSGDKELGILAFVVPLIVSYGIVRRYYRRRDALQAHASPTGQK
jgi:hypothetical protein